MDRTKAVLWCICLIPVAKIVAYGEETSSTGWAESSTNGTRELSIYRGVKLLATNDEVCVRVRMFDLMTEYEGEARHGEDDGQSKKNPLKKLGTMMMMVPFLMQLLSLPGAIASIKLSLLKSIFVAKLAIVLMLYNAYKNNQRTEVVVYQQPQYHEHYYNDFHQEEDDDKGWWGR